MNMRIMFTVGNLVDRAINHRLSIGRYFIDAPQPNIGHMSVVYRSTVDDMSVSCINLAGESNGFPFERF